MQLDGWDLAFRPGGWVRATNTTGLNVFLRLASVGSQNDDGAPLRVHTALLDSPQPVTARIWREVPFADIEVHARVPEIREVLTQPAEAENLGAAGLSRYFDRTSGKYRVTGFVPSSVLRAEAGEPAADFTLVRPPDGRITDEFLENLAGMYRWAVESGRAPAPLIAESAQVPTRTVHRWVSVARQRGFLPPAVQGRAG